MRKRIVLRTQTGSKLVIAIQRTQNFFHFLGNQTEGKTDIHKKRNGKENHEPLGVRLGMLKFERKQESEGEEQAIFVPQRLKILGHSPPTHHRFTILSTNISQKHKIIVETAGTVRTRT